jgi:hypothetical protein
MDEPVVNLVAKQAGARQVDDSECDKLIALHLHHNW